VLEAVLFDWANTLVEFTWDDELLTAGHRAGLAALGRDDDPAEFTARFRDGVLERMEPATDYAFYLRELLGPVGDDQLDRFVDAEHEAWRPAHVLLGSAHALLDSLRGRALRTGIVANSWPDPARLLRDDLERFGIAERIDVAVFSEEAGVRKPDPAIFVRALGELDVAGSRAMFVGDRLVDDVQGAAEVGMVTVQALWFNADDTHAAVEPDFLAFTPMDVLNLAVRLARTA